MVHELEAAGFEVARVGDAERVAPYASTSFAHRHHAPSWLPFFTSLAHKEQQRGAAHRANCAACQAELESKDETPEVRIEQPSEATFTAKLSVGGMSCESCSQTITKALERSCNTTFGAIGLELGDGPLRRQADLFGFGQSLNVPTPAGVQRDWPVARCGECLRSRGRNQPPRRRAKRRRLPTIPIFSAFSASVVGPT